jgi:hypothetical protein
VNSKKDHLSSNKMPLLLELERKETKYMKLMKVIQRCLLITWMARIRYSMMKSPLRCSLLKNNSSSSISNNSYNSSNSSSSSISKMSRKVIGQHPKTTVPSNNRYNNSSSNSNNNSKTKNSRSHLQEVHQGPNSLRIWVIYLW